MPEKALKMLLKISGNVNPALGFHEVSSQF